MRQNQQSGDLIEMGQLDAGRVQLEPHPANEKINALLNKLWADHCRMQNETISPNEALSLYRAQQAYLGLSPKDRTKKNKKNTTALGKLSPEENLVKAWDDIAGKGKFASAKSKTVSHHVSGLVYAMGPQVANMTQLRLAANFGYQQ